MELIAAMAEFPNLARHIHLPMQSGSSRILGLMNRKYSFEDYLAKTEAIRKTVPDCAITTDIIAGYPSETIEDHEQTLEAMRKSSLRWSFYV